MTTAIPRQQAHSVCRGQAVGTRPVVPATLIDPSARTDHRRNQADRSPPERFIETAAGQHEEENEDHEKDDQQAANVAGPVGTQATTAAAAIAAR